MNVEIDDNSRLYIDGAFAGIAISYTIDKDNPFEPARDICIRHVMVHYKDASGRKSLKLVLPADELTIVTAL